MKVYTLTKESCELGAKLDLVSCYDPVTMWKEIGIVVGNCREENAVGFLRVWKGRNVGGEEVREGEIITAAIVTNSIYSGKLQIELGIPADRTWAVFKRNDTLYEEALPKENRVICVMRINDSPSLLHEESESCFHYKLLSTSKDGHAIAIVSEKTLASLTRRLKIKAELPEAKKLPIVSIETISLLRRQLSDIKHLSHILEKQLTDENPALMEEIRNAAKKNTGCTDLFIQSCIMTYHLLRMQAEYDAED